MKFYINHRILWAQAPHKSPYKQSVLESLFVFEIQAKIKKKPVIKKLNIRFCGHDATNLLRYLTNVNMTFKGLHSERKTIKQNFTTFKKYYFNCGHRCYLMALASKVKRIK